MTLPKLSEDWLATLIGLVIVAVIGLGLLGPGPQSVTLEAAPGEQVSRPVLMSNDWKAQAKLDGVTIPIDDRLSVSSGLTAGYRCENETLMLDLPEADSLGSVIVMREGMSLTLDNQCAGKLTVTLTIDPAIRWPLFNWFGR